MQPDLVFPSWFSIEVDDDQGEMNLCDENPYPPLNRGNFVVYHLNDIQQLVDKLIYQEKDAGGTAFGLLGGNQMPRSNCNDAKDGSIGLDIAPASVSLNAQLFGTSTFSASALGEGRQSVEAKHVPVHFQEFTGHEHSTGKETLAPPRRSDTSRSSGNALVSGVGSALGKPRGRPRKSQNRTSGCDGIPLNKVTRRRKRRTFAHPLAPPLEPLRDETPKLARDSMEPSCRISPLLVAPLEPVLDKKQDQEPELELHFSDQEEKDQTQAPESVPGWFSPLYIPNDDQVPECSGSCPDDLDLFNAILPSDECFNFSPISRGSRFCITACESTG